MFLVGLEMDLSGLRHVGKKTLSIATAGILIPLAIGAGSYIYADLLAGDLAKINRERRKEGSAFWAITLTITSFPDLARILSDVKLLHTDVGRIALSTALISDITAWILLILAVTLCGPGHFIEAKNIYSSALPTLMFFLLCWFLLRPGIDWIIRQTKKKGHKFGETHLCFVIAAVAICGFITDACGSHSMVGGFVLGLIIPHGEFAVKIMERIEEFVNGILLPAFLLLNGLRTNLRDIHRDVNAEMLTLVTVAATSAKIVSTVLVYLYYRMPPQDGLALGGLMNTKGVLALIVLNEGRSLKAMDSIYMLSMVLVVLIMTFLVGPIFFLVHKSTRRSKHYSQRTIQRSNPETELRMMTCINSSRNASCIVQLLRLSNATRKSPICLFSVHLVELTGRAATSAMLIVNDKRKTSTGNVNNLNRDKAESELIINAFENYEAENDSVTVHPLTAVSPYATMHEDIFNLAEDKRVAMILVPFHKQSTADDELPGDSNSLKEVNQNLLANAPCSVGILVDRGLQSSMELEFRIAMIFIGGPDDHEALSYGWRMAGSSDVTLTVIRFLPGKDVEFNDNLNSEDGILTAMTEIEREKDLDDEFINDFRFKTMCDEAITYYEKQVNNCSETVESIVAMCKNFDLYIVGRGYGVKSPLTKGLSEWNENPELGPIGDTLVSSEFTSHASVLVVQQSVTGHKGNVGQKRWASPVLNPDYDAFLSRTRNKCAD
ncbi:Cation/H(+) antiporter [Melia azedarach]|uniref:Cation/H(+) antiporter n=1 Tax=Melia azedarach TaxID=155640 RepID=A0ACC1YMZ3_MELAZ|nr:Cation/H(+) antiporter [Melia azedarach]